MSARPFASGTVSFGLVTIPIKLYATGESAAGVQLNMLHKKCGTRLRQQYVCPTDEEVVPREEMVKGYEYAKGQYVLFSEEELKVLARESTNTIEISEFVPVAKIDPIYFDKAWYLGPDKGGERPYRLLSEAMKQTGRAALASYAARGKDYLVLIRPYEGGLLLQQLRYQEELRPFDEVPAPPAEVRAPELQLAVQLIEQIATDQFRPEAYEDQVKKQTRELIEKKIQGQEITAAPEAPPKAQIIDLMAALKASLAASGTASAPAPLAPMPPMAQTAAPRSRAAAGRAAAASASRTAEASGTHAQQPVAPATPLAARKPPHPSPRKAARVEEQAPARPARKKKESQG